MSAAGARRYRDETKRLRALEEAEALDRRIAALDALAAEWQEQLDDAPEDVHAPGRIAHRAECIYQRDRAAEAASALRSQVNQ